ncbi:hypothetical protein LSH36_23g10027 [Paralvinella palmiformis]|uniref:HD domain-containing protein n=1 Tax=Paralvinella palmiformis TaxID=53620 RepID=A0AAD9NF14_9ANNE|nr:hypothetical protein LSH36_23g10027 [Paralvinella palmiformis]
MNIILSLATLSLVFQKKNLGIAAVQPAIDCVYRSTKRAGWVKRGIEGGESVADHMYRMASLAFLIGQDKDINKDRCIKLALVHDMAESIVGDITPDDGISKKDKQYQEENAMDHIATLVDKETGEELKSLWLAFEYEKSKNEPNKLQEFFDSTKGKFQHPLVQGWVEELCQWREKTENVQKSDD